MMILKKGVLPWGSISWNHDGAPPKNNKVDPAFTLLKLHIGLKLFKIENQLDTKNPHQARALPCHPSSLWLLSPHSGCKTRPPSELSYFYLQSFTQ